MNTILNILLLQATDTRGYLFASDKIYTVLTVVLIIWAGIIGLLIFTNLRINKLEKEIRDKKLK